VNFVYEGKSQLEDYHDGLEPANRNRRPIDSGPTEELPSRWQSMYAVEALKTRMEQEETSNAGKLKASKVFKRLDTDHDGYITRDDLDIALDRYKVDRHPGDVDGLIDLWDESRMGTVNIGEFTRKFVSYDGNVLDAMSTTINGALEQGGVTASRRFNRDPAMSGMPDRTDPKQHGAVSISKAIKNRVNFFKPTWSEAGRTLPPARYGLTEYPDTRHVTQPMDLLSGSYLDEPSRFKTTNSVKSIHAKPDYHDPQMYDAFKKSSTREFRLNRLVHRHSEMHERRQAADAAAQTFDELKIARKALNQLVWEHKVRATNH